MAAPPLTVEFEAIRRRGDGWLITWRIRNRGSVGVRVVEAWHPHARLRSSRLRRDLAVPAKRSASLEMPARIDSKPGDMVENTFVILRVRRGREGWRVLARSRLRVDEAGIPRPEVERVDIERA